MAREQIRSVQGTEDVLPAGWGHWRRLYDAARSVFELSGYGEVRTPVIEDARLFFETGLDVANSDEWPEWKEGVSFKQKRDGQRAGQ